MIPDTAAPERMRLVGSRYVGLLIASDLPQGRNEYVRADLANQTTDAGALDALRQKDERIRVLTEALTVWIVYGCPVCGGDCAGANPPVVSCPVRLANRAMEERGLWGDKKAMEGNR